MTAAIGNDLRLAFESQRAAWDRRPMRTAPERRDAIAALLESMWKHESRLLDAARRDFGQRSERETRLLEMLPVADDARYAMRRLGRWMRPRRVAVNWQFLPSRARVVYQPLGVVGIIGAWNYPALLTLSPLVGALAAGNHAMIKPSELAPACAEIIREIIADAFPADYVTVIPGDARLAAEFAALPFDHLLFTGSTRVGRMVMLAAAENLTPVTLELGGKSPAIVHESFPLGLAADRICAAKLWNAGQTCVAPDYVLVPENRLGEFVAAARAAVGRRMPALGADSDYTGMISGAAWQRMQELLDDAAAKGATLVRLHDDHRSDVAGRVFAPTLVTNVSDDMRLMQEEIFGPILPVVGYPTLPSALDYVNRRPRPLALYYFDYDRGRGEWLVDHTTVGGVTINDCVYHLVQHNLPFGGVGPSGMGAYHGFDGFATFSKKTGVLVKHRLASAVFARLTKPPYDRWTDRMIDVLMRRRRCDDDLR